MNLYTPQKKYSSTHLWTVRERQKRVQKLMILFSIIFLVTCVYTSHSSAATNAVISGAANLNIRSGPGTSYDNLTADDGTKIVLPNGYSVSILEEKYDEERNLWYKISFTYRNATYEGYAVGDYIKERNNSIMENDFEAYLTEQGFPESYKPALRTLHSEHPKWIFEALHTGLDWQKTVNAESEVGKNLVQNNAISSWKSMESGAYNWDTNTWVVFDGSDWVAASRELIAYYLDPRNFLDNSNIFMFETLSYDNSYQNINGVQNILNNSFMSGNCVDTDWTGTYAEAFIYAAEQSGVSPYHLASRSLQELSPTGSSSASGTVSGYEGHYNFYNIGATSSSNPILNGLNFAKQYNDTYFLPWNTKWKAIAGGAIYLGKRYINIGQDTLYLQKFNVQGSNPYTHQYMTNVQAASSEAKKMAMAYGNTENIGIIFKIPIFENMPSSPSPLPTGSGSSVAVLSELSVSGYSLTPTFNKNITTYDLVLSEIITEVTISAKAADASSSVSGTGVQRLQQGLNTILITVAAPNGNSTTYTINIVVPSDTPGETKPNGTTNPTTPQEITISAKNQIFFTIQEGDTNTTVISGFEAGAKASDMAKEITASGCKVEILNSDRTLNTGIIATGNIVQITSNSDNIVVKEIPVVIYGDINGDGAINGKDILYLQRYLLEMTTLTGVYAEAGDVIWAEDALNSEGNKITEINAVDMLYLQRHLLDMKYITQNKIQ